MRKLLKVFLISILAIFLVAGTSTAKEITIFDQRTGGDWHGAVEDQEVEPAMLHGQEWDLEGFFLDGTYLSMVGGYDFVNPTTYNGIPYLPGDIFIDVDGDAQYGNFTGPQMFANNYDWVIDVDWGSYEPSRSNSSTGAGNYSVYMLDGNSDLTPPFSYNDPESSPFQFTHTGETLQASGSFIYQSGLSDFDTGFLGVDHYSLSGFDLSFLGADFNNFIVHFTMECGNDNLMGMNSVPEPSTMLLFGACLIGMAAIGRKDFFKK